MASGDNNNGSRQTRKRLPSEAPEANKRVRQGQSGTRLPSALEADKRGRQDQSTSNVGDDDTTVLGVDIGSTFTAAVFATKDGKRIPVNDYDCAPTVYGGRPEEISEVPSVITMTEDKPKAKFVTGYKALSSSGTTWTNLKSMMTNGDGNTTFAETRNQILEKLRQVNRRLSSPLTAQGLMGETLKEFYSHVEYWCEEYDCPLPSKTMASHPVHWSPEDIIQHRERLELAGFPNVETLNEAEAAADAIIANLPASWFSQPKRTAIYDLGGLSWDIAGYLIYKIGEDIVKDELFPCTGGEGGMALVDELASDLITRKLGRKADLLPKYMQDFRLQKTQYNPEKNADLVFGSPPITISESEMAFLYEVALQPMLDAIKGLQKTLKAHRIKEVFLVGGTSRSRDWLGPALRDAIGYEVRIVRPKLPQSTLVAWGATCSASRKCIKGSRLNNLVLGHLVSRDYDESFSDETEWGQAETDLAGHKSIQVVEIVKPRAEPLFANEDQAPLHWLKIVNPNDKAFGKILQNTQVRVFATAKEGFKLHPDLVHEDDDYYQVASRKHFDLEVEPRHVFNQPEIRTFLELIKVNRRRFEYFYAMRFWHDGVGIRLKVGWRDDFTKGENGIDWRDLGRVKFLVSR